VLHFVNIMTLKLRLRQDRGRKGVRQQLRKEEICLKAYLKPSQLFEDYVTNYTLLAGHQENI